MLQGRPVSEVFSDIVANLEGIIRAEFRLARAEVREQLRSAVPTAVLIGVGVLAGIFSLFFLLLCATDALSLVIPTWAAALVVGVGLAVLGAIAFAVSSHRLRKHSPPVPKTIASMKENVEWMKAQAR